MCIIAAKPVGVDMPSDEIIENMWYGNSDGAGFMWAENGGVHIRKGFMKFADFDKALSEWLATHDPLKTALVMHFRITTHGGTKPENCHPFPVSDSIGMLTKSESKCRVGVAHNGIIPITPRKGISDTMEYIITQLAPLARAVPDFYKSKDLCKMISNATGSRLAFLNGRGEIYTIGDFIDDNGIKYSNTSYKWGSLRDVAWSHSYGCYSGWDDTDDSSLYDKYWDGKYADHGSVTGWATDAIEKQEEASNLGCFFMMTVMWLDYDFGYLTGVDEYDIGESYAIDRAGNVYYYDYELDALRRMQGATAYSNTGTAIRFNEDSDSVTKELVYYKYNQYSKPSNK